MSDSVKRIQEKVSNTAAKVGGFVKLQDTDIWECKDNNAKYNPVKLVQQYNMDDMIVLKDIENLEETQVGVREFKEKYIRVSSQSKYKNFFFI